MLPILTTETDITVFVNNEPLTISKNHPSIMAIKKAINDNDGDQIISLLNVEEYINTQFQKHTSKVELRDGVVYYNGEALDNDLTRRILDLQKEGFGVQSYLNFLDKLMQNPSYNSRQQLYRFIGEHKLPITEDGDILGYKGVTEHYKDCHTKTFDNSVGVINEMDRNLVDDNPTHSCSAGFHVGSENYATEFGHTTVIVKVNPKDAVSVPNHDTNKLRVCRYEVVGVYQSTLNRSCYADDGTECNIEFEDFESLLEGDEITFDYNGIQRYCMVDSIKKDYIIGLLSPDDLHYSTDREEYRRFNCYSMENIELV